ncbi:hypothetical protein ACJMK2_032109 [Sinanodonta woodiana]|uniref:N-acetylgalactosaminide beta-1,3-galactosyltransferase n=1 Tax=Sinanodonta woodiana TaxID=1069815 RepID=A0ABD3X0V3_SINWO
MNLIHKVRNAFEFIHDKYIDEVDLVFKSDDDTYAIIENLRFLPSHYNASKPGYLGFIFDKYVTNGYMSGWAGYVISRQGIKQLVQNDIRENKCPYLKTNKKSRTQRRPGNREVFSEQPSSTFEFTRCVW